MQEADRVPAETGIDGGGHEGAVLSRQNIRQAMPPPELSIVIPVYKSELCLDALVETIASELKPLGWRYEIILVNDFSPDRSWNVIESLCQRHSNIVGVNFRRNFGQDNAILTGLRLARGRYCAIMDDDLQHHPKYLPELRKRAEQGADVVYANFAAKKQKAWKNAGSWLNGKIADWVLHKPRNVYLSPYKLIAQDVVALVCEHAGPSPYIDGLLFDVTWRIASIPAEHMPRYAGESSYRFWRSAGVSARLLFSSVKPLRLMVWVGLATSGIGLTVAVVLIAYGLLTPHGFPWLGNGWATLIAVLLVVSGVHMVFAGILGEYVGRTFLRVNERPQTSIAQILNRGDDDLSAIDLPPGSAGREMSCPRA